MDVSQLKERVDSLIKMGNYEEIQPVLMQNKKITERDNGLATVCYLYSVYEQEKAAGQDTIFSKVSDLEELLRRYTALKFYLRRIDFDVLDDRSEFYQFLSQKRISSYELLRVMDFSVVNRAKVLRAIDGEMIQAKPLEESGEDSGCPDGEQAVQEVCFIICTNDQIYAEECIYYINHLIVPEGITIDILTVEDAASMTAGYNEAMRYSGAKYKVYLHQDTFLINPYFIRDILQIFQSDRNIGMIGVIGAPRIPAHGVMWDAKRYGMIYEQHIYETVMLSNPCIHSLEDVEVVDGLLMITQYDIDWREDVFDKWDFYDCSQSMEFMQSGYRIVVPKTEMPWCVHDCGFLNLEAYDREKDKFVREYLADRRD